MASQAEGPGSVIKVGERHMPRAGEEGRVHFWNGRKRAWRRRREKGGHWERWGEGGELGSGTESHLEGHLGRSAFSGHPGRCRAGEASGRQDQLGSGCCGLPGERQRQQGEGQDWRRNRQDLWTGWMLRGGRRSRGEGPGASCWGNWARRSHPRSWRCWRRSRCEGEMSSIGVSCVGGSWGPPVGLWMGESGASGVVHSCGPARLWFCP